MCIQTIAQTSTKQQLSAQSEIKKKTLITKELVDSKKSAIRSTTNMKATLH
jgi:hypothetical protein